LLIFGNSKRIRIEVKDPDRKFSLPGDVVYTFCAEIREDIRKCVQSKVREALTMEERELTRTDIMSCENAVKYFRRVVDEGRITMVDSNKRGLDSVQVHHSLMEGFMVVSLSAKLICLGVYNLAAMKVQSDRSILDIVARSVVFFDMASTDGMSTKWVQKYLTAYNHLANDTLVSLPAPLRPPTSITPNAPIAITLFSTFLILAIIGTPPCPFLLILFSYCPACFLFAVDFGAMICGACDKVLLSRVTLMYRE